MVDCGSYETTVHCHLPQSYISILQDQRPNILPRAVHNHRLYVTPDGTLESKLLQSAPVVTHLPLRRHAHYLTSLQNLSLHRIRRIGHGIPFVLCGRQNCPTCQIRVLARSCVRFLKRHPAVYPILQLAY